MPRETVLLGDRNSGTSRGVRRKLFFVEPNSGRITLREQTGHVGGRSRASQAGVASYCAPPVFEGEYGRRDLGTSSVRGTPIRVGGGVGRGSNDQVRAHLDFAHSLRTDEPEPFAVSTEEWRAATGFPPDDPTRIVAVLSAWGNSNDGSGTDMHRRVKAAEVFDSEEDRRRVGFVDRGRRRAGSNVAVFAPGRLDNDGGALDWQAFQGGPLSGWQGQEAAGGPSGPKALVAWRDFKAARAQSQQRVAAEAQITEEREDRDPSKQPPLSRRQLEERRDNKAAVARRPPPVVRPTSSPPTSLRDPCLDTGQRKGPTSFEGRSARTGEDRPSTSQPQILKPRISTHRTTARDSANNPTANTEVRSRPHQHVLRESRDCRFERRMRERALKKSA
jgi:hypothetical protein